MTITIVAFLLCVCLGFLVGVAVGAAAEDGQLAAQYIVGVVFILFVLLLGAFVHSWFTVPMPMVPEAHKP